MKLRSCNGILAGLRSPSRHHIPNSSIMQIISLNGRPMCGKTSTLLALCDMLNKTSILLDKITSGPDKRMTFNWNGVVICVCTGGDTKEVINNNIVYFELHHAAIAITANRSKAAPKWTLENYANANDHRLERIVMPYANFLKPAAWAQVEHLVAEHIYEKLMACATKAVGE